mmetsp:Transcript_18776/g.28899  ORF Transcript_18776/g.28899 Transcript_18776/m.28899 type:complete len:138 (+) Transcript_18776:1421-1834(+)
MTVDVSEEDGASEEGGASEDGGTKAGDPKTEGKGTPSKAGQEIKELLMYVGGAAIIFAVFFCICYCIKKRNQDRTFKSQSIYVRDMDEDVSPGEKPKKLRLISAHGEQTGVLVTSNTFSASSSSGKKNYSAMNNESI